MVNEIASEVGVDKTNLLTNEVDVLSHKLEDVKSALTTITNLAQDSKTVAGSLDEKIIETSQYLDLLQEVNILNCYL